RTRTPGFGGHGGGGTPGPIPNPEVKPSSADGTARETEWESRSLPRHRGTGRPSGRPVRIPGTLARMPKSLQPRAGHRPRGTPSKQADLPPEILEEVRRSTKPTAQRDAISRLSRAIQLLDRDDPGAAGGAAEKAQALSPRSASGREVRGPALYGVGRWKESLNELKTYRRL